MYITYILLHIVRQYPIACNSCWVWQTTPIYLRHEQSLNCVSSAINEMDVYVFIDHRTERYPFYISFNIHVGFYLSFSLIRKPKWFVTMRKTVDSEPRIFYSSLSVPVSMRVLPSPKSIIYFQKWSSFPLHESDTHKSWVSRKIICAKRTTHILSFPSSLIREAINVAREWQISVL